MTAPSTGNVEAADVPQITVLGAGVVGLTVAAILALKFKGRARINVVGQSTPLEPHHDPEYTSPKAGANWHSFADETDLLQQKWDSVTFRIVHDLFSLHGEKTHVRRFPSIELRRAGKAESEPLRLPWFSAFCPGFRVISDPNELAQYGADAGYTYGTVCFDSPRYLVFLQRLIELLGGSVNSIPRLGHINELLDGQSLLGGQKPDVLFVCTGIGARKLGGINDLDVYPTRGQVVVVEAPDVRCTGSWIGDWSYSIPRGDGTLILGGTYQADDWNVLPVDETTEQILASAPQLPSAHGQPGMTFKVLYSHAGLRPTRKGGIRIAKLEANGTDIVTAYGHGGYGYQSSWGSCLDAVNTWLEGTDLGTMEEGELRDGLEEALAKL